MAKVQKSSLSSAMAGVSLDDLSVDAQGKVQIANPAVAQRIAKLKGVKTAAADSLNTGTCNNTACFAPGLDQLAKRGNPAG